MRSERSLNPTKQPLQLLRAWHMRLCTIARDERSPPWRVEATLGLAWDYKGNWGAQSVSIEVPRSPVGLNDR